MIIFEGDKRAEGIREIQERHRDIKEHSNNNVIINNGKMDVLPDRSQLEFLRKSTFTFSSWKVQVIGFFSFSRHVIFIGINVYFTGGLPMGRPCFAKCAR